MDERATANGVSDGQRAYELILDRIVRGEYRPGMLLSEHSVSASLDLGRTPVRESLQRLAYEGFVEVIPRRGTVVRLFDHEDFRRIVDFRIELECIAARWAAMNRSERHLSRFKSFLDRIADIDEESAFDPVEVDLDFHSLVAIASGNEYLANQAVRMYRLSLRSSFLINRAIVRREVLEARGEYRSIVDAIRRQQPDRAERLMREHDMSYIKADQ